MDNITYKKIGYDLNALANAFSLQVIPSSPAMHDWTSATYQFTPLEQELFNEMAEEVTEDSGYWNEEELKIDFVGFGISYCESQNTQENQSLL